MLDPRISTLIRLGATVCDEAARVGQSSAYLSALMSFSDTGEVEQIGRDAWKQIESGVDPEDLWGSTPEPMNPDGGVTHDDLVAALIGSCWRQGQLIESTILLSSSGAAIVMAYPTGYGFRYTVKVNDFDRRYEDSKSPTVAAVKMVSRDPAEVLSVLTALRFIATS